MRRTGSTLLGLAAVVLLACAPPAEMAVDTAAEVAAVEAVRAQEIAAIMAGDTSSAYMTDDVVVMPPGEARVVGKAAAQAWAAAFRSMMTVQSLSYGETQITVAGDWAIESYVGTVTLVPAGGGDPVTETVKGIHIYRKGADGTWKMAMDIWNMDTAPPMM